MLILGGAYDQLTGRGGGGFIVRDWQGSMKGARSFFRQGLSAPMVEHAGAYEGIKFAVKELQATKLWVVGGLCCSGEVVNCVSRSWPWS